jgi:sarcosine oxidase subunit beta
MRKAAIVRTWAGIEGELRDSIPVIGLSTTAPNFVHAFGFSAHGFQLGPVGGQIVAELIETGESSLPIEAFTIRRFRDGGLRAAS